MKLPAYVPQLLQKHINEELYCVCYEDEKMVLKSGRLVDILADKIILQSKQEIQKSEVKFYHEKDLAVFNIYNKNMIDLIKGKAGQTLDAKLSVRVVKKSIMTQIKPFMNKDIYIVYKSDTKVVMSRGQFTNMGIMGITIKPAPFYNSELEMMYRNILHIYNQNFEDLLEPKLT